MEYSVEDLSKLANVSIRTLHYYDEIDLIKPVSRMVNGRRYYGLEEISILMNILFFKKIGFNLKKIKTILKLGNKDVRDILTAKKHFLKKEIEQINDSIKSIEVALNTCYKGDNMSYSDIGEKFKLFQKSSIELKRELEKEYGSFEEEDLKKISIGEQQRNYDKLMSTVDKKKYFNKISLCMNKIVEAIDMNLKEDSKEVQHLMQDYYDILNVSRLISKKEWVGISVSIMNKKEIYIMYAQIHTKLPEFLVVAIKIFSDNIPKEFLRNN